MNDEVPEADARPRLREFAGFEHLGPELGDLPVHVTPEEAPPPLPDMPRDARLARATDAAWVRVGQEIVVHAAETETSCILDPVAALVWECLDGEAALGEILDDVADVYGVARERVADDFRSVVGTWVAEGIAVDRRRGALPRPSGRNGSGLTVARRAAGSARWTRLPDPPNSCGNGERGRWPLHVMIGVGDTALSIGTDSVDVFGRLEPWRIGEAGHLIDFGLRVFPDPPADPTLPRPLPILSHGCDQLTRGRDADALVATLLRLLAAYERPPGPGQLRLDLSVVARGGVALLAPTAAIGMVSDRWLATRGFARHVTTSTLVDPATRTVWIDPLLGSSDAPTVIALHDWWIPTHDQHLPLSPGAAVAAVMRLAVETGADLGGALRASADLVLGGTPGFAPWSEADVRRALEQALPATQP